jgi:4-hydroxybenzoate polyprenyltransferase
MKKNYSTVYKLKHFLKLIRWFHELLAILPFVALYLIIDHYSQKTGQACDLSGFNFFILCICVQLLIAAGCIHNDIRDRDIDKINKPGTHTVDRVISLKNAQRAFIATTVLIIILSVYVSLRMFKEWAFIATGVYILSLLYNIYLKRSPLFGNILMAFLAAFIPLVILFFAKDCITQLHNEKINVLIYLYALYPFLIIIPRELSLDISDVEGDKAGGCKTLPIVIGVKKARTVVVLFIILAIAVSLFFIIHYPYLAVTFFLLDILLVYYIYKFTKTSSRLDYIKIGRFLWFIMIIGLIGFSISTLYAL